MRLEKINIRHYRSIENISVIMPKNKPLIFSDLTMLVNLIYYPLLIEF